jgi:hypothetical protein
VSLPHQIGLGRESEHRPDSGLAAEVLARGHRPSAPGRIEWTRGNVARLVVVVLVSIGVLAGVVVWGIRLSSTDQTSPRGAANAYFAALARGDEAAAEELECAGLYNTNGRDIAARALREADDDGPTYAIGPQYGDRHRDYFFDFEVFRRARGTISVREVDGEDRFLVCDFFDVQVWKPRGS